MNKKVIYNSESFASVISEVSSHIANIKDCFNGNFELSSYKGSKASEIEYSINNILLELKSSMDTLDNINSILSYYKESYDSTISTLKTSVGGE